MIKAAFVVCILALAAGQAPQPAGLSARQQAMWQAANGFFDSVAHANYNQALTFLTPNVSFFQHMNPGFVQLGGNWWGASKDQGFLQFGQALSKLVNILTDPSHGVVRPVAIDDSTVYVRGTRSVLFGATGIELHNTSVAGIIRFDSQTPPLIHTQDVYYESSTWASASCPSGRLACVSPPSFSARAEAPQPFDVQAKQAVPVAPTPDDQANLATLGQYWTALAGGNTSAAEASLSEDVVTTWYGDASVVPFAGQYSGIDGWQKFLSAAQASWTSFTLIDFAINSCVGGSCVASWKEYSYSAIAVPRPVDGLVNLAFYTFDATNKITAVDVYTDSLEYGIRLCDSFLRCTAA